MWFEHPRADPKWGDIFSKIFGTHPNQRDKLFDYLKQIENGSITVCPKLDDIFKCFVATPLDNVLCLILGNDPYPYSGYADGLAFSISDSGKYNQAKNRTKYYDGAAMRAVLNERWKDEIATLQAQGTKNPVVNKARSGDLMEWAKKGVLLLNRCPTVGEISLGTDVNKRTKYKDPWMWFTEKVVKAVSIKRENCVFIFLGSFWRNFLDEYDVEGLNKGHHKIVSSHPSAGIGFRGSRIFSKTLDYLYKDKVLSMQYDFTQLFPMP